MTTTTTTTTRTTSNPIALARVASLALFVGFSACAPSPVNSASTEAPLKSGAITDFVPAAGLRWLAVGRPSELENTPSVRPLLRELLPDERLEAFARSTAVDLRETPNALAAGYDYGALYVVETPYENRLIEARFVDRLVSGASIESKHPHVRRVFGTVGSAPEALVRVDRRFVAFAAGDPSLARIVELFVLGRLTRSAPALKGAALAGMPAEFANAPVRFYAPGPFTGEWERGARGLLGATTAFGAMAVPDGDALVVKAAFIGTFDGDDISKLSAAWGDLAQSSLGRLTGIDQPIAPPSVETGPGRLTLEVKIALKPLFSGLRAAVAADVWEMLQPPSGPSPAPSGGTKKR